MEWLTGTLAAPALGLFGGILLGLAARRGRFCTLGAIEDALYAHSWTRLRMWSLALAVAIAGTAILGVLGWVDTATSVYGRIAWNPAASIIGGLIFGYGMAIAGNCGYGALARLGGGDMRSFVIVIVMGLSAYAILSGPLAGVRLSLFPPGPAVAGAPTSYADLAAPLFPGAGLVLALAAATLFAAWALKDATFRSRRGHTFWAFVVGIAVVSGWWGTTYLSRHSFDVVSVQSHTFASPFGETMLFLMTGGSGLSFTICSVLGVVLGALLGSISKGHFRWEACDDPGELGRQILGGGLMGIGAVLAVGCSVGQGLTAFSALSLSAPVVLGSIVLGAALGLRQLIRGFDPA